jgi:hypothetical protein
MIRSHVSRHFLVWSLWAVFIASLPALRAQSQQPAGSDPALQVAMGRDSPNLGGNTFRNAFVSMTVNPREGSPVSKVVNEVSFLDDGQVAFERAELTPDATAAGVTLEVEQLGSQEGKVRLRLTLSSSGSIPSGILANLVFQVVKEYGPDELGSEEHLIMLENQVTAWAPGGEQIAGVEVLPGTIDLAYAPVVFACFFYMH